MRRSASTLLCSLFLAGTVLADPPPPAAPPAPVKESAPETPERATPAAAPPAEAEGLAALPAEAAPAEAPGAAETKTGPATPSPAAPPAPAETPVAPRYPVPAPADALPARPKGPISSRFNVGFHADVFWFTGRSYDLFSANDLSTSRGISLGYAVLLDGPLSIVPELGFGGDVQTASGLFGGALASAELETWRFYGGASVRYAVLSFLEPHARITGGAAALTATIAPSIGSPKLVDDSVSPFFGVGGGFTLKTPNGALETAGGALRTLVLGLSFEGGYVVAKSVELHPVPEHDTVRLPTSDATLGTLSRSAPYLRISMLARF